MTTAENLAEARRAAKAMVTLVLNGEREMAGDHVLDMTASQTGLLVLALTDLCAYVHISWVESVQAAGLVPSTPEVGVEVVAEVWQALLVDLDADTA